MPVGPAELRALGAGDAVRVRAVGGVGLVGAGAGRGVGGRRVVDLLLGGDGDEGMREGGRGRCRVGVFAVEGGAGGLVVDIIRVVSWGIVGIRVLRVGGVCVLRGVAWVGEFGVVW